MQRVKQFLADHPRAVHTYVTVGFQAIALTTKAMGLYMRHLLRLKGLDPDSQPGSAFRKALQDGFDHFHENNQDLDHKWVEDRFKQVNSKFPTITEEEFKEVADISKWREPSPEDIQASFPFTYELTEDEPSLPVPEEVNLTSFVPSAPVSEKERERERENKLDEIAKARLRELEKILDEKEPFDPQVDLPGLVERGKLLKEIQEVVKSAAGKKRSTNKFKGSFKRSK